MKPGSIWYAWLVHLPPLLPANMSKSFSFTASLLLLACWLSCLLASFPDCQMNALDIYIYIFFPFSRSLPFSSALPAFLPSACLLNASFAKSGARSPYFQKSPAGNSHGHKFSMGITSLYQGRQMSQPAYENRPSLIVNIYFINHTISFPFCNSGL